MNVPEGVDTVTVEGRDLKMAIAGAAEQLGIHPAQVDYKLDLSHFRSPTGVSLARNTVRIVAWGSNRPKPEDGAENGTPARERRRTDRRAEARRAEAGEPEAERGEGEREGKRRGSRKKGGEEREGAPRAEARPAQKPETLRGAEDGSTEASDFAQQWFEVLMRHMGVEGTVTGTGSDDRVHLSVKAERAGRIVGKRGATLGSIRHLLDLALEQRFGKLTIDVDVGDDRPPQEREPRAERGRGRERDRERPERGERGDRERGRGRGRYPEAKLKALARRAAEKALESGQTITINLELNSFDRRIVHLEVSRIDGVESHSEERTDAEGRLVKYVQIHPLLT